MHELLRTADCYAKVVATRKARIAPPANNAVTAEKARAKKTPPRESPSVCATYSISSISAAAPAISATVHRQRTVGLVTLPVTDAAIHFGSPNRMSA